MKTIVSTRAYCWEQGTFSRWLSNDGAFSCYAVEQPWVPDPSGHPGGLPFHSCVPEGSYLVFRTTRPKFGDCFVLVNEDLGIYEWPHPNGRDSCLIHEGNVKDNVEGCNAVGNKLGVLNINGFAWAVLESNTQPDGALRRLHRYIGDDQVFHLSICANTPNACAMPIK